MGNGARATIEEVGVVSLYLPSGHIFLLKDVIYVPLMRRNLISISALDKSGYSFDIGNKKLNSCSNFVVVGFGVLRDSLYMLNVDEMSVNSVVGNKCGSDEKSSII